jgi:hypothetical protein
MGEWEWRRRRICICLGGWSWRVAVKRVDEEKKRNEQQTREMTKGLAALLVCSLISFLPFISFALSLALSL